MNKILILIIILLIAGIVSADSYVYANGQRVAKVNETGVFYYHSDHLGSTSAVTNSEGEVIEDQVNLPFGEPGSGSEKYGFTGKEKDETELHYSMARYYDPSLGRFMNVDPVKDGMNWFVYANNNPLKFIDPTGKWIEVTDYMDWDFGGPQKGEDLGRLMTQVEEKTGIQLGIWNIFGLNQFYPVSVDETRGSKTARKLMMDALHEEKRINLGKTEEGYENERDRRIAGSFYNLMAVAIIRRGNRNFFKKSFIKNLNCLWQFNNCFCSLLMYL